MGREPRSLVRLPSVSIRTLGASTRMSQRRSASTRVASAAQASSAKGRALEVAPRLAEVPDAGGVDRGAEGVDWRPEREAGSAGRSIIGEGALGVRRGDGRGLRGGGRGIGIVDGALPRSRT